MRKAAYPFFWLANETRDPVAAGGQKTPRKLRIIDEAFDGKVGECEVSLDELAQEGARQMLMNALRARWRFVREIPEPPELPTDVWVNPPTKDDSVVLITQQTRGRCVSKYLTYSMALQSFMSTRPHSGNSRRSVRSAFL